MKLEILEQQVTRREQLGRYNRIFKELNNICGFTSDEYGHIKEHLEEGESWVKKQPKKW